MTRWRAQNPAPVAPKPQRRTVEELAADLVAQSDDPEGLLQRWETLAHKATEENRGRVIPKTVFGPDAILALIAEIRRLRADSS